MFIPHGKYRLLKRSALDFGQEICKFLVCGQLVAFYYVPVPAARTPPWVRGILAKHRAEASRRGEHPANVCILLFIGIFA